MATKTVRSQAVDMRWVKVRTMMVLIVLGFSHISKHRIASVSVVFGRYAPGVNMAGAAARLAKTLRQILKSQSSANQSSHLSMTISRDFLRHLLIIPAVDEYGVAQ